MIGCIRYSRFIERSNQIHFTIGVPTLPDEQRVANNSQTFVVDADDFTFETLEQENGQATVVRFALNDPRYHAGDVLLVLSGSEIHFHGMIRSEEHTSELQSPCN